MAYRKQVSSCAAIMAVITVSMAGLFSSCHSSRSGASRPGHPRVEEIRIGHIGDMRKKIIKEARSWIGTPYKYAGQEKGKGADCSGMVMMVYERATGDKLPRNSAKQAEFCKKIDASDVDAGDLVFFATGKDPDRISHVGIVIDNENFIHASSSKGVVISNFTTDYYQRTFRMFGRVPRSGKISDDD